MDARALFLSVALLANVPLASAETTDDVASRYKLTGELLVSRGDHVLLDRGYGTVHPDGSQPHKAGERWRLASITKQVTAALLVRDHWQALDKPIANLSKLTLRQLLTHHTGLANPDDTPKNKEGFPSFYTREMPNLDYCRSKSPKPGSDFSYNNCDYLMAATLMPANVPWPAGMHMARSGDRGVPGFISGKPEPALNLATFGAAAGLIGTARAVFRFDRALMSGKLLTAPALDALWKAEGNGSYQALGQWVFSAPLKGCGAPVRIVQRDGEIAGVQARNFILPDLGMTVIVFSNRSSDDFAMGEVWQGSGFTYDLLSAAACQNKVG